MNLPAVIASKRLSYVCLGTAFVALLSVPKVWGADAASSPQAAESKDSPGTVIHIGDSFVAAGLQQALRPKFASMGSHYYAFGKTRAWLSTWAWGAELQQVYGTYRPSLVLITLGANEVSEPQPARRAPLVKRLVGRLQGTPCVWISTPLWKGAPSRLFEMIRQESAPCRYYDSSPIAEQISRQSDHIHPDPKGGAFWADQFFSWLLSQRLSSQGPWSLKPAPDGEHGPSPQASGSSAPCGSAGPKSPDERP